MYGNHHMYHGVLLNMALALKNKQSRMLIRFMLSKIDHLLLKVASKEPLKIVETMKMVILMVNNLKFTIHPARKD